MKTQLFKDWQRFRETSGYCTPPGRAACAIRSARTLAEWRVLESAGLVRLRAEPEQESYFSVFGEPDGYEGANGRRVSAEQARKEMEEIIERDGNWCVVSQYWDGEKWRHADSIGQCTGYSNPIDPFCNDYVVGLMASAISKVEPIPQPGEH